MNAQQSTILKVASACGVATVLAFTPVVASADWEPERTVEVIIPSSPGGGQDLTGRTVQRMLDEVAGIDSVAVNQPGGGGATAWAYLNQNEGDGHFLAISSSALLTGYALERTDVSPDDITPIVQLLSEYSVFTVAADSDIESGRDMVDRLAEDPRSLSISIGTAAGNASHIALALVANQQGIDPVELNTVVFDSGGASMSALLGGHIDVQISTLASVVPQLEAENVRVIAISSPERLDGILADVPTWVEQDVDVVADRRVSLFGPRGLSDEQVTYWEEVFADIAQSEEWNSELEDNFRSNTFVTSEESRAWMDRQLADFRQIFRQLDLID